MADHTPSKLHNDLQQVSQPTGLGGVAGGVIPASDFVEKDNPMTTDPKAQAKQAPPTTTAKLAEQTTAHQRFVESQKELPPEASEEDRKNFEIARLGAIEAARKELEAEEFHKAEAQQVEANQTRSVGIDATSAKPLKADGKFFPVRVLRGMRPAGEYKVIGPDGKAVDPPQPRLPNGQPDLDGSTVKVLPGTLIMVPTDEAKKLIKLGIAERADDIG